MNSENIYTRLKDCGTSDNTTKYQKQGAKGELFGVSITDIEKIKEELTSTLKSDGALHTLAKDLWKTRNTEARILACMIADPEKTTRNMANQWISVINFYLLADHFSSLIAKTRFGMDIMYLWIQSPYEHIKRTGYLILNNLAKNDDTKSELFFKAFLQKIKQEIQISPNWSKEAMYECLISIASKSKTLKEEVINTMQYIGSIEINYDGNTNKTIDIIEELNKL